MLGGNRYKVWYNNGVMEGMYNKPPSDGWVKGRLPVNKKCLSPEEEAEKRARREAVKSTFTRPQRKS